MNSDAAYLYNVRARSTSPNCRLQVARSCWHQGQAVAEPPKSGCPQTAVRRPSPRRMPAAPSISGSSGSPRSKDEEGTCRRDTTSQGQGRAARRCRGLAAGGRSGHLSGRGGGVLSSMPPHWPHAAASSVSPSAPDRHEFPNRGCSAMTWTPIASAHTPLEWLPNPASPWRPGPPRRTPKTTGSHPGARGWPPGRNIRPGGHLAGAASAPPGPARSPATTGPPHQATATPAPARGKISTAVARVPKWPDRSATPAGKGRSCACRHTLCGHPQRGRDSAEMAVGAPGELPTTWTTPPSINLRRHGPQGPLSPSGRPLRHAPGRRATSHRSGTTWSASAAALTRRIRRPIP